MSFECDIVSQQEHTSVKVTCGVVPEYDFATLEIMGNHLTQAFANLTEPQLRTLAIALNMAADELQSRKVE